MRKFKFHRRKKFLSFVLKKIFFSGKFQKNGNGTFGRDKNFDHFTIPFRLLSGNFPLKRVGYVFFTRDSGYFKIKKLCEFFRLKCKMSGILIRFKRDRTIFPFSLFRIRCLKTGDPWDSNASLGLAPVANGPCLFRGKKKSEGGDIIF